MRARIRWAVAGVLTLGILVGLASPASAATSDQTFRRRVGGIVAAAVRKPQVTRSVAGIVVQRNGRVMHARNANVPLTPASLQKLVTTTAAILTFGHDHRFATRLVTAQAPLEGIVAGDAALVGGGDPTFATMAFGRRNFIREGAGNVFPTPPPTVESLADAIVAAGIRRIDGNLLADESLFDSVRWQRGWLASYQRGEVDVGNLSALTVNMGCADIRCGRVAPSPAGLAATLLRDALRARGVSIAGEVRSGRAPAEAREIAAVRSPPLREIVAWTNRWSVNYPPELLLKGMGAAFGGAGTTRAGAAVVRNLLAKMGVDVRGLAMEDGSGLSVLNRVTPATLAQVIQVMLRLDGPQGAALRDSMPVAGRPGTLLRRMRAAPAGGNLRGKTGLIRGVRGLAGWVRARDGSIVVYVSLFNRVRSPQRVTPVLDAFGLGLAGLP